MKATNDWNDLFHWQGQYKRLYRVQFCMKTGSVRAKMNESETWLYAVGTHTIYTAEFVGYELLGV